MKNCKKEEISEEIDHPTHSKNAKAKKFDERKLFFKKVLTTNGKCAIISRRTEKGKQVIWVCNAGVAEQVDARDLKSRDAKASYRFDSGHRHHRNDHKYRGVEQLVARRAHNPEAVRFKSHPRNQKEKASYDVFSF